MADKAVKTRQTEKNKKAAAKSATLKAQAPEKPKALPVKAAPAKPAEKKDDRPANKQPGKLARWWSETRGELRKVTWPTRQEALRLTRVVLIVVAVTSVFLGLLDWIFSKLIGLIVTL